MYTCIDFPCGSEGRESTFNIEDLGSIPGLGRSPREENSNLLQYSCLENPMDGEFWWTIGQGLPKSWTQLSN